MGRSKLAMRPVQQELIGAGYIVWNQSYASTSSSLHIAQLANTTITDALHFCRKMQTVKIHFVSHSLGGILIRHYLQNKAITELGNIVMLSPPNQGSEVVDTLKDYPIYQFFTGLPGQQLGTDKSSLPLQLKPIKAHIGIITGNASYDPWFSSIIPGDDDGKVSTRSARLKEMADFLVVDAGHTFIMRDKLALKQIIHFLKNGAFKP